MNRAALIALAATLGWGLAAAHAAESDDRSSPARAKPSVISTQQGNAQVQNRKHRERGARRLLRESAEPKHASRPSHSDRLKTKESSFHAPAARADKNVSRHAARPSRSDRLKTKESSFHVVAARADKNVFRHAARPNRGDRLKTKESSFHAPAARADKNVARHASRPSRGDRLKTKEASFHAPAARADKAVARHAARPVRSDRFKIKQPNSDVAVTRTKVGPKHAARGSRNEALRPKQAGRGAAVVRINGQGSKHRVASLDQGKTKQIRKIGRSKVKNKPPPTARKQKVRHAAGRA